MKLLRKAMLRPTPVAPAPAKKAAPGKGDVTAKTLLAINKVFGVKDAAQTLFDMDQETPPVTGWIKTNIWAIDYLVGKFRGIPMGRGLVIWGPESVGKSSFADYLTLLMQRKGGIGLRLDYDDTLDPSLLKDSGVDFKRLIVPKVVTLEDGFDAMAAAIDSMYGSRSPKKEKKEKSKDDADEAPAEPTEKAGSSDVPLLCIWDSINSAPPKVLAMQESAENSYVGAEARAYSIQLKRFRMLQKGRPVILLLIGEVRQKVGGMPGWGGPQDNLSGGKAMRHYPTTILKFTGCKLDKVERKGRTVVRGMWVFVSTEKARKGMRGVRARFYISFSETRGGPDPVKSNFDFLMENKFIKPSKGMKVIRGLEDEIGRFHQKDFRHILKEHEPKILKLLRTEMLKEADPVETDDTSADFDD